jgi:hypothetical protein
MSQESLLREKQARVFEERDREERHEAERRRHEWEEVESSAFGGLRKMPEDKKRSYWANQSTIGGVSASVQRHDDCQTHVYRSSGNRKRVDVLTTMFSPRPRLRRRSALLIQSRRRRMTECPRRQSQRRRPSRALQRRGAGGRRTPARSGRRRTDCSGRDRGCGVVGCNSPFSMVCMRCDSSSAADEEGELRVARTSWPWFQSRFAHARR